MRREWQSVTHLFKVVISHNQSTHEHNLGNMDDNCASMDEFLTSCNNPFVLARGICHDMGSLQARQVTNQKASK